MTHVIPCMLHACMALTRVMLNQLCSEGNTNPELAATLSKVLTETCGIKLAPDTSSNRSETPRTFLEQIEKSKLQQTEFLNIVENQGKLLEAYI